MENPIDRIYRVFKEHEYNFVSRKSCEAIYEEIGELPEDDEELFKLIKI